MKPLLPFVEFQFHFTKKNIWKKRTRCSIAMQSTEFKTPRQGIEPCPSA